MVMTSVKAMNGSLNEYGAVPKKALHNMGSIMLITCGIDSRCVHQGVEDSYLLLLVSLIFRKSN